ncbi:MAG: phage portal protein [Bacteroidaceae bacterium]|nr:phage portal protein [Bacteroidaceae bacterium]
MPDIKDILNGNLSERERITALKEKTIKVPLWTGRQGLINEYDPTKHPVMDKQLYPDLVKETGIVHVTRITLDFQRLATKRMSELVCGIPVKRVYKPETEKQKEIASYLEAIFERNRIDSVNTERCNMLFGGCEIMTLWYATEQPNTLYGFNSKLKLRCRNFSPMQGDDLYPLFDEYGDMTAMSVAYTRKVGRKNVQYFDTYTEDRHIKWSNETGEWLRVEDENITLLKIPCIYAYRPTPIWEDTSRNIFEMEWVLSRNGNYLRENSKPRFIVFADEIIHYGDEGSPEQEHKSVMQYPKGASASYVTWQQAIESLKYHIETLRSLFFTQLQLPDWSYEKMSQQALSGESRKQMFIDAKLKVKDESGRLIEFFDREVNVVKAFLKLMLGGRYHAEIDALPMEIEITPFAINDDKEQIDNLLAANGNKPLISQRESIELLGWSNDTDQTLKEIAEQDKVEDWGLTEPIAPEDEGNAQQPGGKPQQPHKQPK